jgi:hypothetical protein
MIHTTRRLLILSRLADRQSVITIANGFTTDAGLKIYIGAAPELSDGDPDEAIAIVPRDDLPKESGYQWTTLPVEIQALGKAGTADAWSKLEVLLGAIKIATELPDRTLGSLLKGDMTRGSTRVVERPPGSTTIALGVIYVCSYVEPWGNPTIGVEEDT